jgi:DNA-binding beta-propeller fold protein YncE
MKHRKLETYGWIGIAALLLAVAGCAAPQKIQKPATLFYPDPPDLPRIQFLTSFTGAKDIEVPKSAFDLFIIGERESESRLDKPYGIAVHQGKIYVCDTNRTVMIFDLEKRKYGPLQGAQGMGKLIQPLNIRVDADGNKYVVDTVRRQVIVFDKNDFYAKAFSIPREGKPVDAVPFEDRLYVTDIKNGEVVVLDIKTGSVLKAFGQGDPGERLHLPTNLAFDRDGILYVSDGGKFQIFKFDRDGHFRGTIGRHGSEAGAFARPRGVAVDRENRLYAVDAAFENIQIFSTEGQMFMYFGKGSLGTGGLYLPAKVAIDYENKKYFEKYVDPNFEMEYLLFVTNQFGTKMVNVYAFGKEKGKKYPKEEELAEKLRETFQKEQKEKPSEKKDEGE